MVVTPAGFWANLIRVAAKVRGVVERPAQRLGELCGHLRRPRLQRSAAQASALGLEIYESCVCPHTSTRGFEGLRLVVHPQARARPWLAWLWTTLPTG